jgi:hypothetical protein
MPLRSSSSRLVSRVVTVAFVIALGACAAAGRSGIEPRYVAVHNALAAMGMAQVGPFVQGSLAEGREDRVPLELGAECTTIVAIGGAGVRDVDIQLLDPTGNPIAHDVAREPEATVRACVSAAGAYTLVLKMVSGGGDYTVATWTGGAPQGPSFPNGGGSPAPPPNATYATGTCDSPIAIAAGNYTGSTSRGESENEGSCANSGAREMVYKLELLSRQHVTVDVDPHFDSVLYIRKDQCDDPDSEVACNDDAPNQHRSKVDLVLDPGTYFVFVDGYSNEGGTFSMHVAVADVPSIADVCRQAPALAPGPAATGTTSNSFDRFNASCGDGAKGPDTPYRLELSRRVRVRVVESSNDFGPVVHVRRQCADESSEIACSDSGANDHEAAFVGTLDPGAYAVIADAVEHDADGQYTVSVETSAEQGTGTQGDTCGDAVPLPQSEPSVVGDTFLARDDVAGRCSGASAGDVIYRVEIARRSRVTARMTAEEGEHVFSLSRTCADRSTEIACERAIDQVLTPGTYFLAVDGAGAGAAGRFAFDWRVRDVAGQEAACRSAPVIADGQTVAGNSTGAADKFNTSCGGPVENQSSPDRMYRLVLGARAHVRLLLATPGWDGVLAVRSTCLDPAGAVSPRASELACNNDADDSHHARIDAVLDAGTYYVLVDGHAAGNAGTFSLEYHIVR